MDSRRPDQRRRPSAKRSLASSQGEGHGNESGVELKVETAPQDEIRMPYPLTFALTSREALRLQLAFSKLGLMEPPSPNRIASTSSTNPSTPIPSYPGTPNALPRGASPFVPLTALSASSSGGDVKVKISQPQLSLALTNAFDDSVLPLTSRLTLRSFLYGYLVQAVLSALIPGLLGRKSPREVLRSVFSLLPTRTGFAFAIFTFLYRAISYALTFVKLRALTKLIPASTTSADDNLSLKRAKSASRLVRLLQGDGFVPFVSAIAASPALHLLPSQTSGFPRKTFALDLFTKGLYHQVEALSKRRSGWVTWIPDWCDTALLYAIGNGQLLWAFLFEPLCFPKSYGDFILARSSAYVPSRPTGMPSSIRWPSRREIADHVALLSTPTSSASAFPAFQSPALSALNPSPHPTTVYPKINPVLDWSPAHPSHTRLLCAVLHPTEPSCRANYLNYWASEWKNSAKFVALFTAFFNVFKIRSWKRDPEGSLFRFVMSVAQGATMISGSIATAWAFTCIFQQNLPRNFIPRSRYFLNGFLSSVFIFAVPAARRAQLGLYVARLSMDSTWQILVKQRKTRSLPGGDVYLLAIGLALLASRYESTPYLLSGYVRRVLRTLTGPRISGTPAALAGLPIDELDKTPAWSVEDVDARLRARAKSRGSRSGSEVLPP